MFFLTYYLPVMMNNPVSAEMLRIMSEWLFVLQVYINLLKLNVVADFILNFSKYCMFHFHILILPGFYFFTVELASPFLPPSLPPFLSSFLTFIISMISFLLYNFSPCLGLGLFIKESIFNKKDSTSERVLVYVMNATTDFSFLIYV